MTVSRGSLLIGTIAVEKVLGVGACGALDTDCEGGGGVVKGYPQDTQGKKISAKFLYNTTRSLDEQTGFTYLRPNLKNHCVMRRTVSLASPRQSVFDSGSRLARRW